MCTAQEGIALDARTSDAPLAADSSDANETAVVLGGGRAEDWEIDDDSFAFTTCDAGKDKPATAAKDWRVDIASASSVVVPSH